ncbi:hypothetical protein [Streptococcus catagoni]|uniref:hypothetical protein n=1 Tax=Streptococcus catagoni TaxID=2654874 RepID=UPI00140B12C0|nr:hypothetical protein [Streptococcus catagoni]
MLKLVIIGLAVFSVIKIILFIKISDIFLPKIKKKNSHAAAEDTHFKDDQDCSPAEKEKRDYF